MSKMKRLVTGVPSTEVEVVTELEGALPIWGRGQLLAVVIDEEVLAGDSDDEADLNDGSYGFCVVPGVAVGWWKIHQIRGPEKEEA